MGPALLLSMSGTHRPCFWGRRTKLASFKRCERPFTTSSLSLVHGMVSGIDPSSTEKSILILSSHVTLQDKIE